MEAQLNALYAEKAEQAEKAQTADGSAAAAEVADLKASLASMEAQLNALYAEKAEQAEAPAADGLQETIRTLEERQQKTEAELAQRNEEATGLKATVADLEGQIRALQAERETLTKAQTAAPQSGSRPAADLAAAMQATDIDQPIYVTLHGTTYDLTEAPSVQACRDAVVSTLGDTGVMLVKLLQHRVAQERFRELSSTLPGGGHNTARMTQLGKAIADASQRLAGTFVDGKAVSQLVSRLYQERGLLEQCIQSLQSLDMETRRHAKGD
jgi:hypothetical protein